MCARLNFSAADCLFSSMPGETVGRGVMGRQLGRNAAFDCPYMCGETSFILINVKILSKTLLMAKNDV